MQRFCRNNNNNGSKLRVSSLALALTALLCPAAASAAGSSAVPNSVLNQKPDIMERGSQVAALAAAASGIVGTHSTALYLQNRRLGDVSTFPLRVIGRLNQNPWQAAPFMPIADRDLEYYYGVPAYREPQEFDRNTTPVNISADQLTADVDGNVVYEGGVVITQGDIKISSDRANYNRSESTLISEGHTVYTAPNYTVSSNEPIVSDLETKTTIAASSEFQLHGSVLSGRTGAMTVDTGAGSTSIKELDFTTCPVNNRAWHIEADEVELAQSEYFGEAYGTKLYLDDVPVFYLPYINFPITNRRKTGLLYPEISVSSSGGFEYSQPIYLNLAPNYDDTITPSFSARRGFAINNEFRYMPFAGTEGSITVDFLPNDREWELAGDDHQRWMLAIKQQSRFFDDDLVMDLDYERVRPGDWDFISDIGADDANVTDDYLRQSLKLSFTRPLYNVGLELRKYQSLIPEEATQYRPFSLLPQLKLSAADNFHGLLLRADAEITRFESDSSSDYHSFTANRWHFEPSLEYQLFNDRGTTLNAMARGFLTHYDQDDLSSLPPIYQSYGFTSLDSSANRALYLLELHGKTTLERKALDLRHTQTLEPEIVYQYIPYKNQDHIGLYDTTDRVTDYYSNFSYHYFTGLDRIADLNRVTMGLTSRLLDAHDREIFRASVSQAYAFVPTRVKLNPRDSDNTNPRSPLAVTLNASPIPELTMHASASYNNETNRIDSWNAMAEYVNDDGFMFQLNYRYTEDGNLTVREEEVDLSQLGVQLKVPLNKNWSFTAAMYYDLEQHDDIDRKIALRYEESCYAIAVMYEDYNKMDWSELSRKRDRVIGIQFEFKGLGAVNIRGKRDPSSTDTYLLDHFNPTNLNR